MEKLCIDNLPVEKISGKSILVRVDFNVPLSFLPDKSVTILDDARIKSALETIEYLISKGAKIILCSHLGRPKSGPVEQLSLAIVATRLSELLGDRRVIFIHDCIGEDVDNAKDSMTDGSVLLLENLRFHAEEEMNDQEFGRKLVKGVDVYVNDAFGSSHRAHASIVAAAVLSPLSCEGFLMRKELRFLGDTFRSPGRPLAAVVGGAKVSTKLKVLRRLLSVVDKLILGGAMVYTFYKAMGFSVGDSLVEDSCLQEADSILRDAEKRGVRLLLSCDSRIVSTGSGQITTAEADSQMHTVSNENIPDGWMGVDIGELSLHQLKAELQDCKTILWNGPMGKAEKSEFAHGSWELARYLSDLTATKGVVSIICGGDTVAVVDGLEAGAKLLDQVRAPLRFSHVSSGGGAALEFLQGDELPGITALPDRK